jgi:hypothetical protein
MWNICNIQINTPSTYIWKNRWNIENKSLQHTCTTIATYATSQFVFVTSIWNTCNIPLKHLKHLKQTLATCAFKCKHLLAAWTKMEARRRGAQRRRGARCYGVARRSPVWSSSAAGTSAGITAGRWPARPQWEAWVRAGARGASAWCERGWRGRGHATTQMILRGGGF